MNWVKFLMVKVHLLWDDEEGRDGRRYQAYLIYPLTASKLETKILPTVTLQVFSP
jgi:hypothetical protein